MHAVILYNVHNPAHCACHLFSSSLLLQEKNLLLHCGGLERRKSPSDIDVHTDGVVFEHAERTMCSRSHECLVVAGQRHADEAHRDGS